jgi:protein SCO1/2
MKRNSWVFTACSLTLFVLGNFCMADTGLPAMLRGVGLEQRLDHQVPLQLQFKDETGRVVTLQKYFGTRPVILTLNYYQCPMLCTEVLNGLVRSLRALTFDPGKQFEIVTVSFDSRETPAMARNKKAQILKEYARAGAGTGWHFLTGDHKSIQELTRNVGFRYNYDSENNQFAHTAGIMILTPGGKLARYFYGVEYSSRDVRLALVEASENQIGNAVDQVLLFCFHYDPSTGKYGAYAVNLIRAGGILTVLALGIFIVTMKRKMG